jgi:DNA-binding NarL/FixJ family response regulator
MRAFVVDLVVRGLSTKAVASEVCISVKTVQTHRAHINQKLAAHCPAALVRYAFRARVPPAPPPRGRPGRGAAAA